MFGCIEYYEKNKSYIYIGTVYLRGRSTQDIKISCHFPSAQTRCVAYYGRVIFHHRIANDISCWSKLLSNLQFFMREKF
jgi:hypothetical protein